MKTLFIVLALSLTMLSTSWAQTEKGRWTLGTQIGNLSYSEQSGSKSLYINVTPSAGYFIVNGLALGMGIPVGIRTEKNISNLPNFDYKSNSLAVGLSPFVRYFLGQGKLKPYVGISYSYSKANSNNRRTDLSGTYLREFKGKSTVLIPTLGLAYFLNQHLGLTVGLNYNINHDDENGTISDPTNPTYSPSYSSDYKSLSLAVGFQLFIGK